MGSKRDRWMRARTGLGVVLGSLALSAVCVPAAAVGAECTNTWVGPGEGDWQLGENWSAGKAPSSTEVACLPKEKTAVISTGSNFAEVLQGEGGVTVTGGTLAPLDEAEPSNIGVLHLSGGVLRGPSQLSVTKSLIAAGGAMEGAGSTVIGVEASGLVEAPEEGEAPGLRLTEARSLVVHGTLGVAGAAGKLNLIEAASLDVGGEGQVTVKGPEGRIAASEATEITNDDRLTVEGAESRLTLSDSASLLNAGIVKLKSPGAGLVVAGNASVENADTLTLEGAEGEIRVEGATLENSGTLTVDAPAGRIRGSENALLDNSGALIVNGEGEGNGLVDGAGTVPRLINTGSVSKAKGTGATIAEFKVDNESTVVAESGTLAFTAGGNSGQEATDLWEADPEAEIVFDEGDFTLGESSALVGSILCVNSASVKTQKVAAEGAELAVVESSFELTGAGKESHIGYITISAGEASVIAGGILQVPGEAILESGAIEIGAGSSVAMDSLVQAAGVTQVGANADLVVTDIFLDGGSLDLGASVQVELEDLFQYGESDVAIGDGSTLTAEALFINEGTFEAGGGATLAVDLLMTEPAASNFAVGGGSTITGDLFFIEGSSFALGEGTTLATEELYLEGGVWENEPSVILQTDEMFQESGTLMLAEGGGLTADKAFFTGGLLTGSGSVVANELALWDATMEGEGLTEVLSKGKIGGRIICSFKGCKEDPSHGALVERRLVTHGSFTLGVSTLEMSDGAVLENHGEFDASSETTGHGAQISIGASSTSNPRIVNYAEFNKETGTGTTEVTVPFKNNGKIGQFSGTLSIKNRIGVPSSERFGYRCYCGDPVETASGDLVESQTDFAIGGVGVGLGLERSYSAQAAAAASAPGRFGYGWSHSFSDHLLIEAGGDRVTVVRGDGSTVPFEKTGGGPFEPPAWSHASLTGNAETGYTYTEGNQVEFEFSGGGALESVIDRNGNETTLSYEAGRLKAVTDPAEREMLFSYNEDGLVESVEDPMGHVYEYGYDGDELTSVTMPGEEDPRWQFDYDGSHRLTSMFDGRGGETTNEYDSSNRVLLQTDPEGRVLAFQYDGFHTRFANLSTGAVTDQWFDSSNQPFRITRGFGTPQATTEEFSYDAAGHQQSRTDGNGHTTEFTYNAAGDRTSVVDPEENETKWAYNATHDVISETTPKGQTTTIVRDAAGNPETITRPAPGGANQVVSFEYDARGRLKAMTDPLSRTWKYGHNAQGDLISETNPEGDTTTWSYDANSRVIATVSPRGNDEGAEPAKYTTTYERDLQGRVTEAIDPLGHSTEYVYDGNGNLEVETDANGHTTTYTYNAADEPVEVEHPNGDVTKTGYDGNGEVVSQTDGNGEETHYVRNPLGQAIEVVDPLNRATTKQYDDAGNVVSETDAEERTTTFTYDDANRLSKVAYSDGVTPTAEFFYDADGNLTKVLDGTGESSYAYDQLGRMTEVEDGNGKTVSYEYNLADEQTGITYPNGKSVTQGFDKAGRLKSVADWLGGTTTFDYDSDSNLASTTFPTGTGNVDEYTYDRVGRMTEVEMRKGAEPLASLAYLRDKVGQVEAVAQAGLPGAEAEGFSYDANDRLVLAGGTSYAYDAAGNPTSTGDSANAYDDASQLVTGTGVSYAYNDVGERTHVEPRHGAAPRPAGAFGSKGTGNGQFNVLTDVAIDPTDGTIWVADDDNDRIQHFSATGTYIGQFKSCYDPGAVEVDASGNLYLACSSANLVQKYSDTGAVLKKIAGYGSGEGQVIFPLDLALDAEGDLWVADTGNDRVSEFDPTSGFVGSITLGSLSNPWGVDVAPNGNVWVTEPGTYHRVSVYDAKGKLLFRFGSEGSAAGQFAFNADVEVAAGYAWVTDAVNDRVQVFDEGGKYVTQFGEEGTGAGQIKTDWWLRIAVSPEGDLWLTDAGNERVQRWSAGSLDVSYDLAFGSKGTGNGQFNVLTDVAIDPTDGTIWVADDDNDRIQHFSATGTYIGQFKSCYDPGAVEVDASGNLYLACSSANLVQKYSDTGAVLKKIAGYGSGEGQVIFPLDLALDAEGDLWVADTGNDRVSEFDPTSGFVGSITLGSLSNPWGVDVAPNGNVWVTEPGTYHRVSVYDAKGKLLFRFGSEGSAAGQFAFNADVEVAAGYAWVTDAVNDRVQVFDEGGKYVTQFGEEGTGAGQIKTDWWLRIAVSPEGDLWLTDAGNERVQRWSSDWIMPELPAIDYEYDQAGNLTAVESNEVPEATPIDESYAYDGTGLRVSQTVSGTTRDLAWDRSGGLPMLLDDGERSYIYGPHGVPIAHISASGVPTYYHHDQLGSTRMLTTSAGSPAGKFTYSAYGSLVGASGTLTTPMGFAGQYTNAQSGLQYLRARVFDPATAQFMSRDPLLEFTGSVYIYAEGNPLKFTDPSGLCALGLCDFNPCAGPVAPLCELGRRTTNAGAGVIDELGSPIPDPLPGSNIELGPKIRNATGVFEDAEECSDEYRMGREVASYANSIRTGKKGLDILRKLWKDGLPDISSPLPDL